jgi:hypothetical protein
MDYTDLPMTECLRGNDAEMLCFALERVHKQFAWKTGGLNAEQLRRTMIMGWIGHTNLCLIHP